MIYGIEALTKTRQLKALLVDLAREVPELEVRDHWDADLDAIGLCHPAMPSLLIYICCHRRAPGRVCYSLDDESDDGKVSEQAEDVSIFELVTAVRRRIT